MRGGWVAAGVSAVLCCLSQSASGAEPTAPATFILFSGVDSWRNGSYLYGGTYWAPTGIDRDGFIAKVFFDVGRYKYDSDPTDIIGQEFALQILPGWRFGSGSTELKIFAGLDTQYHRLDPDDPGASLRGSQTGLRASFEFWTELTKRTMVTAYGSHSTVGQSTDLYAATGLMLNLGFYVGPEVQYNASSDYWQYRGGAHITGVKMGAFEWGIGTGFARDSDGHKGLYGRFEISSKR